MTSMPGWLDSLHADERPLVVPADHPHRVDPQLAVPDDGHMRGDAVYERKLDGMRFVAHVRRGQVELRTRTNEERSRGFPELVDGLLGVGHDDLVVDGEVVAFDGANTSFSQLQRRIGLNDPVRARLTGVAVHLFLFDLLHLDGYDLRGLALVTRKRLLQDEIEFSDPIHFTPHHEGDPALLLAEACQRGWEGLVAKDPSAPYRSGRGPGWRKLKCSRDGDFVIGGWTEPQGSRTGFGALLLGYPEPPENDGASGAPGDRDAPLRLRYAGKVGTGFDHAFLTRLSSELARLELEAPPFVDPPRERGAHWVDPCLVATVAFSEWTRDGRLRHPRFQGLRPDKRPQDVGHRGG